MAEPNTEKQTQEGGDKSPSSPSPDPVLGSTPSPQGTPKGKTVKMLRIIAKRDGFRRCGMAHSEAGALHPMNAFSKDERKILDAERWLVVDEVLMDPATGLVV